MDTQANIVRAQDLPEVDTPAGAGRAAGGAPRRAVLRGRLADAPPWLGVLVVLVAWCLLLAIRSPVFLTVDNLQNVLQGAGSTLAVGAGITFLLALGLIDLSVGGLMVAGMMLVAGMMHVGTPMPLVIVAGVLAPALVAGVLNGGLVAKAHLNFFVVTLGTMSMFSSLAQIPTDGATMTLYGLDGFPVLQWLGSAAVLGLPVPALIGLACLLVAGTVLYRTGLGQALRAIGGNEVAARTAGIRVERLKMVAFGVGGAFVGVGGLLLAGRAAAVVPGSGTTAALAVLAAVLVGGSSFFGGQVSFVGTFLGVVFIALLENGLNLLGVSVFWQGMVSGGVLIAAVFLDRFRNAR